MHSPDHAPGITRRRLLLLLGSSAAGAGLLAATGNAFAKGPSHEHVARLNEAVAAALAPPAVAATPALAREPLASFRQSAQAGFVPINSTLTFGAPTDLAAGWDGTAWAIDDTGAPHLYDPLSDTWQLHGTGIDAAALIDDTGPAVYFRGGEMFVADGQHSPQAISTVWPDLPRSYQLGVQGAIWSGSANSANANKLVLFRGGTFLTAPWPPPGLAGELSPTPPQGTPTSAAVTPTAGAGTATPATRPSATALPTAATPTPTSTSATPPADQTPTPHATATNAVYHAALLPIAAAATGAPTAAPKATPSPSATPTAAPTHTAMPTGTATPAVTPTSTATPTSSPVATRTPAPSQLPTAEASPTGTAAVTPAALADYVAMPLTDIPGWPQSTTWQNGVLDGVYGQANQLALLIRGTEWVRLWFQPSPPSVLDSGPFSQDMPSPVPSEWLGTSFAGFHSFGGVVPNGFYAFRKDQPIVAATLGVGSAAPAALGVSATRPTPQTTPSIATSARGSPSVVRLRDTSAPQYVAQLASNWPSAWHPQLQHAPNGRTSGLWGATIGGQIVSFDGTAWTQQIGDAVSVSAGKDGSVFAVGKQNSQQLSQWNGSAWNPVATHSSALSQVAVGDENLVWTCDSNQAVHQLNGGQLQPAPLVGTAAHIAANYDGTLWSCTGANGEALRFASDLNAAPAPVPVAGTVQKVASTGFGTAHCLAAAPGSPAQIYSYDSPFAFRSAGSYTFATDEPIEQGLGRVYFVAQLGTGSQTPFPYQLVALDAHTGVELSRSAVAPLGLQYTAPAFDALHRIVIVGLMSAGVAGRVVTPVAGQLLGLDALDLSKVLWTINLPAVSSDGWMGLGPSRPSLSSTQLCVSDNFGSIIMYNIGAGPTPAAPTYVWTFTKASASQDVHRLPPPVLADGVVYAAWWLYSTTYHFLQLWFWKLDAATGTVISQTNMQPGPNLDYPGDPRYFTAWEFMGLYAPVLGTLSATQTGGTSRRILFVNGGITLWGIDVDALTSQSYAVPGANFQLSGANMIQSGLAFANGDVWFGDAYGNLYGLDGAQLKAVANTPAPISNLPISTTPLPYTDSTGQAAILCGLTSALEQALLIFDPVSGSQETIATTGTDLTTLSSTASNGVVYGGGGGRSSGPTGSQPVAQVFAIRVDEAIQDLRSFTVDSQLMQDFDDPSEPTHNPNGQARYQTHLTVLGDQKVPRVNETVKVWADRPTTIRVNGQTYSIGPDDDSYASLQTGATGSLVIMSGYTLADGSDKTDMSASPLRIWAAFMDPYERLVINPDREYHNRVSTAHATDTSQANADDPTRVNLQTAQTYGDLQNQGKTPSSTTALFSAQQQADNQPQQVANAIQTMTTSVGVSPPPGNKSLKPAFALRTVDTPGKYIPYPDIPGAQYSPYNVAASRAAVVLQPVGFSYSQNSAGTPT